ncbi:hypothetical protein TIFTF001_019088 [Ficus carica]|uniref:Uncharacterized protein n=1 Tax=Ficus carica TaxID=3494 RepID=A0AA88D9V6_FICCA|nr:hypothetical protein TIFTF001_019088 [Ficus carica]
MTDGDEDWVMAAMTDDSMVAELLVSLRTTDHPRPPKRGSPAPPLYWSVRQQRSRHPTRHHGVAMKKMKKTAAAAAEPTRASPTTPLSWSGATSFSGGSDESSKPSKPTGGARSKAGMGFGAGWRNLAYSAGAWNDYEQVSVGSEATTSKRPRKKKTLAELKEEETLLLKERKNLRNEIATMRLKVERQRATQESLNRLKVNLPLDLESQQKMKTAASAALSSEAIIDRPKQVDSVCEPHSILPTDTDCNDLEALEHSGSSNASHKLKEIALFLPDLNLPADGDLGSEMFCGMS